jgi:hypothetical protein
MRVYRWRNLDYPTGRGLYTRWRYTLREEHPSARRTTGFRRRGISTRRNRLKQDWQDKNVRSVSPTEMIAAGRPREYVKLEVGREVVGGGGLAHSCR